MVRQQKRLPLQFGHLMLYQVASDLEDSMTVYRLTETVGIGVLAGLVWFRKGSEDTQTALGETIGLLFFTTAVYTVPPVFQVLAEAPVVIACTSKEYLSGMYHIHTYVIVMTLSSTITAVIWASVWQMITYTLADLGRDPGAMLSMQLTLALNVITMRILGYSLAMVVPRAALNVVIANLFVQMCMLTNGFYTKLPSWLQWITVVSIPRFTLRALLKIEYSWQDSFEVSPMHGHASWGNPTSYIPAELTGTFQLMRERKLNVMESPHDSSPVGEMVVMAAISLVFLLLFTIALMYQVWRLEVGYSQQEEEFHEALRSGRVAEPDQGEEVVQATSSQESKCSWRDPSKELAARAQSRASAGSGGMIDRSHGSGRARTSGRRRPEHHRGSERGRTQFECWMREPRDVELWSEQPFTLPSLVIPTCSVTTVV